MARKREQSVRDIEAAFERVAQRRVEEILAKSGFDNLLSIVLVSCYRQALEDAVGVLTKRGYLRFPDEPEYMI